MATTLVDELLTVYKFRERGAKEVESATERIQRGLSRAGQFATRFGTALTAGLTGVLKVTSTFEDAIAGTAARTGKTFADIQANYGGQIQAIAEETGLATDRIALGYEKAISTGREGAAAHELVGKAAKFEAAGMGDLAEAISTATTVADIFGGTASEALDLVTRSATSGEGNVAEYSTAWKDVASVAGAVGLSQRDVAASLTAVSRVMPSVRRGGTALRSFLQGFLKPTEDMTKALSDFASVNLDVVSVQDRLRRGDFVGVYRDLQRLIESNPDLLGRIVPNIEGIQFFTSVNMDAFDAAFAMIEDSGDAVEFAFEQGQQNISRGLKQILQDFLTFIRELGNEMRPAINDGIQLLRDLVSEMRDLSPEVKKLVANLLLWGPPLLAIGGALQAASFLLGPFVKFLGLFGAGGALAAGLNPLTATLIGIVALLALAVGYQDQLARFFGGLVERFSIGPVAGAGGGATEPGTLAGAAIDYPVFGLAGGGGGGGEPRGNLGGTFNFSVDNLSVNTQATDAAGIARDIRSALEAELQSTAEDFDSSIEG